jgi:hypothetical protein
LERINEHTSHPYRDTARRSEKEASVGPSRQIIVTDDRTRNPFQIATGVVSDSLLLQMSGTDD